MSNTKNIFPTKQYVPQELPEKTLCDIIKTWWNKITTPGPPSKWDNEDWVRYQEWQ